MSALENIEKILADYEAANKALNEALKENGEKCIAELFTKIFKEHDGLNKVLIIGSTPSFNDGDVCEHSQDTFVGGKWYENRKGGISESSSYDYENYDDTFYEFFEHAVDEDDAEMEENVNCNCKTLLQAKKQIREFDEIIERVFHTNFQIEISRNEDGTASVNVDEYDCGY
jgi:hypothetical protein